MKVLIIHNAGRSTVPSGELVVVKEEVRALREKGVEVFLYLVSNDSLNNNLLSFNAVTTGLNVFWSYNSFNTIKELIDRHRPDIAHFHTILPLVTASALYACKTKGVPIVQTLHNYRWFCIEGGLYSNNSYCEECLQRGALKGIIKRCSRESAIISTLLTLNNQVYVKRKALFDLADCFIAVSNFVRDKHIQVGFPADKVMVKYNGLALENLAKQKADALHKKDITFVGRLSPSKGTSILKQIISHIHDIPFNIVGNGPDFETLRRFCEARKFENVTMLGRLDTAKVWDVMSKSACVVIPSIVPESFGLVAIEAMACGTPVVASRVGGLAEIVENSGGGVTVDPAGSPKQFVSAMRNIISSPEKIREMGRRGRNYVEQHFTMEHSVNRLLKIYERVIESKKRKYEKASQCARI